VAIDDSESGDRDLKMLYLFEPLPGPSGAAEDLFLTLRVPLDTARPEVPSVTPLCPAAAWHEREAHDLMGILPLGHPDLRPLVLHDDWPEGLYPLRKSFDRAIRPPRVDAPEFPHLEVEGEGVIEVPVGPIHAGIIEPGHFRFSVVGDVVLHLEARLFYTHRGMEKLCEGRTAIDALHVAERTCGVCSLSHAVGFCEALERMTEFDVPLRAGALRTLGLELERLYNHLGDVGNICAGAAFHLGNAHGLILRDRIQRLNEEVSGSRFLRGFAVPGGVRLDLSPALAARTREVLDSVAAELEDLAEGLQRSPSLLDRLDGTGVLSRAVALDFAAAGVAARASGVDRDARRDHPHALFAAKVGLCPELEVPLGSAGDVHARLLQRLAEARVSIRLARAVIEGLPAGPITAPFPARLPPGRVGIAAVETPRGEAVQWLRADRSGLIDRWRLRSPSYANWPLIPLSLQGVIVPDFPLVNKSFELCYSCTDR
jgi:Ni,Fe-hydrogenase III large subunit